MDRLSMANPWANYKPTGMIDLYKQEPLPYTQGLEPLSGLANTVDYLTTAPLRTGLNEVLKVSGPWNKFKAFGRGVVKSYAQPNQLTSTEVANRAGLSDKPLYQQGGRVSYGGLLSKLSPAQIGGFAGETLLDPTNLLPGVAAGGLALGSLKKVGKEVGENLLEKELKNSLDLPVHPTPEGQANFKKWFEGSKVVDEKGRPIVAYHGTFADFNKFQDDKLGLNTAASSAKKGHFFATNPETASSPVYSTPSDKASIENYNRIIFGKKDMPEKITSKQYTENLNKLFNSGVEEYKNKTIDIFNKELGEWGMDFKNFDPNNYDLSNETKLIFELADVKKVDKDYPFGFGKPYQYEQLRKYVNENAEGLIKDGTKELARKILNEYEKLDKPYFATKQLNKEQDAYKKFEGSVFEDGYADARINEDPKANVMPVYLNIKNPLVHDYNFAPYREVSFADLIEKAKNEGRDGVNFKNVYDGGEEPTDIWVAINPTQIKSATGNRGTFDPKDPNILKGLAPVGPWMLYQQNRQERTQK